MAYELTKGYIPDGLVLCHKCDNPPCCRPGHLKPDTNFSNLSDAYKKGRLHSPRLLELTKGGLRMEKKYGKTPLARRRAQLSYRARERRADKEKMALVSELHKTWTQQRLSTIQGIVRHPIRNVGEKRILLGGRDLFYRELSGEWDEPVITLGKRVRTKVGQFRLFRVNWHRDLKTGQFTKKGSAGAKLERFQYLRTAQGEFWRGVPGMIRTSKPERDYKRQLKLRHRVRFGWQKKKLHVSWDEPNL